MSLARRFACRSLTSLGLAAALAVSGPAWADEVEDALAAALEAWRAGDAETAKLEAEYAIAKMAEADAQGLSGFLPDAPEGWSRELQDPQAGAALFGGGLIAVADYRGAEGEMTVTLAADGPMVAGMAAVLGNPAAMGAMGRLVRAGRHRAVVTAEGEINALIAQRVLVRIDGNAPPATKLALFEAMDLDGLAAR
ncbi:MAG: hypothetical protein AAF192_16495 [Pseudomonadota bacterium]